MKKLGLFLSCCGLLLLGCGRPPQRATITENPSTTLYGVRLSDNFDTYLNQIIALQRQYPITTYDVLRFPIKIHVVQPLTGTTLYEESFRSAVDYLNKEFRSAHIQFDLLENGNDYIYSERNVDVFYNNPEVEQFFTKKTYDQTVINLYVFDNYQDVVGYTHYPILNINRVFISRKHLTDPAFIHEMGHFFGLLHTFEKDITRPTLVTEPVNACLESGDKICDTPADPYGASFTENDCQLFGDYTDGNGQHFRPNLRNFMSYYGSCRSSFSPDQMNRMYFIAKWIKFPQMRIKV